MWTIVLNVLMKLMTSEAAKVAIAMAVNKLLEAKGDGITGDIAETMIDGIAKSQMNPTKADMFEAAIKSIKGQ